MLHSRLFHILAAAAVFSFASVVATLATPPKAVLLREEFADLERWKHFTFPRIERATSYAAVVLDDRDVLKAASDDSASALYLKELYDVYAYPQLSWTWRVESIYSRAMPHKKRGDDHPLRVYVMFQYDPEEVGPFRRLKINAMRKHLGEHIPARSLCYVWSSTQPKEPWFWSPYFDEEAMTITKRVGLDQAGQWLTESVNVLEDFRAAFGMDPPAKAWVAIMNDADNTGEAAKSYLDWLQIGGE